MAYWLDGVRKRQTFDDLNLAKTEAAAAATQMTRGDLDVLTPTSADRAAYLRARELIAPLDMPLETVAAQFVEARGLLGDVPLSQAVEFFVRRHPGKIVPRTVNEVMEELLRAKEGDGLSKGYLRQRGRDPTVLPCVSLAEGA